MQLGDTIIAAASGAGRSPRAVVRVSGAGTMALLRVMCSGEIEKPGARATVVTLAPGVELPVLLAVFRAPRSYTGEDVAELFVPGNPALVERVLARLIGAGSARLAGPGEFTARAYFNGKLTLDQAEGVGAVVAAATDDELAAAGAVLRGEAGAKFRGWSERTLTLLALVEAGIDFTDQEDVVAIAPDVLRTKAAGLRDEVRAFVGAAGAREDGGESPLVVLAGEPNAGKSTLFNALLGRTRAVVSEAAGTTRDVLVEELDLSRSLAGAGVVRIADVAGMDTAARGTIDAAAQAAARRVLAEADVVVHCDPSGIFASMGAARGPVLRVRTKADLPATSGVSGAEAVAVCALDGWHVPVLKRAIADAAWGAWRGGGAVVSRHRRALTVAANALDEVAEGTGAPEVAAEALRAAVESLSELTGRVMPDDVLGRIFASFCVGK